MATSHKDYSGTPLVKKLGIVTATGGVSELAVIGAPVGFVEAIGEMPPTVRVVKRLTATTELAICFTRVSADVLPVLALLAAQLPATGHAWIAWPKARLKPGYNENLVRDTGLAHGLVDYKVCSINEDWSGLKFARRKA